MEIVLISYWFDQTQRQLIFLVIHKFSFLEAGCGRVVYRALAKQPLSRSSLGDRMFNPWLNFLSILMDFVTFYIYLVSVIII